MWKGLDPFKVAILAFSWNGKDTRIKEFCIIGFQAKIKTRHLLNIGQEI
jgi:hypothetical protein